MTVGARHLTLFAALAIGAEAASAQTVFVDSTERVGLEDVAYSCAGPLDLLCVMLAGGAVVDYDRDGWPDLYVLGGGRAPDRLFRNVGGRFEEVGAHAGLARIHQGAGVAVGDVDADGWPDLFVTSWGAAQTPEPGRHLLWRNRGDGTFEEVAARAGVDRTAWGIADGFGACFGDVDLDGDLDLAVAGWRSVPFSPRGNRLFLNRGDGTFEDATGIDIVFPAKTRGFSPAIVDMDGDGWPELLHASDFGTSRYFVGAGQGRFVEAAAEAGCGLDANGMGQAIADLDGDGRLDWYVTSVFDPLDETPLVGDGNKLYWNEGPHRYREGARLAGVHDGFWGWGVVAVDFDHDGRVDLAEVNGFPWELYVANPARLWRNVGYREFEETAAAAGFISQGQGRALLHLDHDRDGDRDLVVLNGAGRLQFFENRNEPASANHWLTVRLDTAAREDLAPDGFGSRVIVRSGTRSWLAVVHGGCSYLATEEPVAHFGLGDAEVVDIEVRWANGDVTHASNVTADRELLLRAPD